VPPNFTSHSADVTSETQIANAVSAATGRFGRLDIVIANAGSSRPGGRQKRST
jgi:NAD(P)-dependent dehydrogenase (short-subunit alcohol dehydrogenase family)